MIPRFLRTVFGSHNEAATAAALPTDLKAAEAEVHRRVMAGEPIPITFAASPVEIEASADDNEPE